MRSTYTILLFTALCVYGCNEDSVTQEQANTRFTALSSQQTAITFSNDLIQTDSINIYTFRNFYNGAGVGLGDFNQDGLLDIFFAGNQVDNELYLNLGEFQFLNATNSAGVASQNVWTTGVSIVDINGDGWLDIYVCKSGDNKGENRHNELFINNGISDNSGEIKLITFTEQSKEYGLDDLGLSTHAAFFDFDKDGDLDCYLLNNSYRTVGGYDLKPGQRNERDAEGGNKLYRNESMQGDNRFTDVSETAGIYGSAIGFGLGVTIADLNGDHWPDIYVSNDFFEKDYMYINQRDGTFSEEIEERTREISMGSMGADIADLTNDGQPEIFVTEMLPREPKRYKTKVQFEDWNKYTRNIENGYFRQFGRNSLQLNVGAGQFSEISRFAGVDATDWSWGALVADYDSDGFQDIFVANGIYLDLLDQDYINFFSNAAKVREIINDPQKGMLGLIEEIPSEPISNYVFTHQGELQFEEKGRDWGLGQKGFSNGAAYGDMDNDGDLDLIINNINEAPFVLRNNSTGLHYLNISLTGSELNSHAVGAKIHAYADGNHFYREVYPQRGFMSSVDTKVHIGLGQHSVIDSIVVVWPSLTDLQTKIYDLDVDQLIQLKQTDALSSNTTSPNKDQLMSQQALLQKATMPPFKHVESEFSDFDRESLLPSMHSAEGPASCSGDINNDGLTDFYIGGASGKSGKLFIQKMNGSFYDIIISEDEKYEETDCVFFDATGNGWLDIYITSGSSEFSNGNSALIDKLYFNTKGAFSQSDQILPSFKFENSSSVDNFDFDLDGDEDLVVGVNSTPFRYGIPGSSYILENDGKGVFQKLSKSRAAGLSNIGMVSDVATGDFDNDGDKDIVFIGEWMAPQYFRNDKGTFIRDKNLFSHMSGLWTYISSNDIDNDGDEDLILGNSGLNNHFKADSLSPLRMYVNDFDQNGKIEQILCVKEGGQYIPLHLRVDLIKQLPILAKIFPNYASFAEANIEQIIPVDVLEKSLVLEIKERHSGVLLNNGSLSFEFIRFPKEAQFSSMYAGVVTDLNKDGIKDIIMGGNQYKSKPQFGIQAASTGICLIGDGTGSFTFINHQQSGLFEEGEIRSISKVDNKIIFAKNNLNASLYEIN